MIPTRVRWRCTLCDSVAVDVEANAASVVHVPGRCECGGPLVNEVFITGGVAPDYGSFRLTAYPPQWVPEGVRPKMLGRVSRDIGRSLPVALHAPMALAIAASNRASAAVAAFIDAAEEWAAEHGGAAAAGTWRGEGAGDGQA